jgi:hypothetical protein
MKKILVYTSIARTHVRKDAVVLVLKEMIPVLNKNYDDLHFTIMINESVPELQFDNVTQLIYRVGESFRLNRLFFDPKAIQHLLKNQEFDVLYCHRPEHMAKLQLMFDFGLLWNISKKIGYGHWFFDGFEQAIDGIFHMESCGVNSQWLKDYILEKASEIYSTRRINQLENILSVCYLGVESTEIIKSDKIPNSIIFNHIDKPITNLSGFLKVMDKLYEIRQDFKVYLTTSKADRPYVIHKDLPSRESYMNFLAQMKVGVGYFSQYSAWSLAVTDGLSVGVPFILPKKFVYPEMLGDDYPYFFNNDSDILTMIQNIFDNDISYKLSEDFSSDNRVLRWHNNWAIFNELEDCQETPRLKTIKEMIHKTGYVTMKQISDTYGWGPSIDRARYRSRLRADPDIILTEHGYQSKRKKSAFDVFF